MRSSFLGALAALAPVVSPQDQSASGFALAPLPYPGATFFAASATTSGGELVVCDGWTVTLYLSDGTPQRVLTHLVDPQAPPLFSSFVRLDPSEQFAIVGESTFGDLLLAPLSATTGPNPIVNLPFNYDAVFEDGEHVLVSAATCGFACGNEIWRVDLATGAATLVALLPGASGPLALDPAGNLYYGTVPAQFPPPPKPSRVVRFDAAELHGPDVLTVHDAQLIGTGFAGAARMAFDPVHGELFLMENNFATGENSIRAVLGSEADSPALLTGRPFFSLGNLEFVPGDGRAAFLPYQPPTGGLLRYTTTDFFSTVERFELVARRPALALEGPGTSGPGPFDLTLAGGPPGGSALILFSPAALVHEPETLVRRFAVPLFFGVDLGTLGTLPGALPLDEDGALARTFQNPGGFEGQFAVQLLLLDGDARIAGTSSVAFL